jgi:3-oxoacid CoA-transferase A subunit
MGHGAGQRSLKEADVRNPVASVARAVSGIGKGLTLMIGGFGGSVAPIELIHALIDCFRATGSPTNLTVINNNAGNGHVGLAALIEHGMVKKLICCFPRSADPVVFTELYQAGKKVDIYICHDFKLNRATCLLLNDYCTGSDFGAFKSLG